MWFSWKLYKICKIACRQRVPYCLCVWVKPRVLFLRKWKIDDHKICLRFTNFWQEHVCKLSLPTFGQTRPENRQTWNNHCSSTGGETPASYTASPYRLCVLCWSSTGISFWVGFSNWQLGSQGFSGGVFGIRPVFLSRGIDVENTWALHSFLFSTG